MSSAIGLDDILLGIKKSNKRYFPPPPEPPAPPKPTQTEGAEQTAPPQPPPRIERLLEELMEVHYSKHQRTGKRRRHKQRFHRIRHFVPLVKPAKRRRLA